jgi:hypothetical protein
MSQLENRDVLIIDAYLQSNGRKRVSVPGDGHCILHSWRLALAEVDIEIGYEKLLNIGTAEISNNLHFYHDFLPGEDLVSQLEAYAVHNRYQNTVAS